MKLKISVKVKFSIKKVIFLELIAGRGLIIIIQFNQIADTYCNAELCFVQEEHKNMGAWSYVQVSVKLFS